MFMTWKRPLLFIILLVSILVTACSQESIEQSSEETLPTPAAVVARVNGKPIYKAEVIRRMEAASGDSIKELAKDPGRHQMLMDVATESVVMDELLLQSAISAGMTVADEQITKLVERTKKMAGAGGFSKMLEERGVSEETFQAFLVDRELISQYKESLFRELVIDDRAIKDYYEGHLENFNEPSQVRLEVFTLGGRETADKIHSLWKGGKSYETISKMYKSEGENIGRRTRWMPLDAVPAGLQGKVGRAETGSILDPVQVSGKFYVVRLLEKQEPRAREFDKVRDEITQTLLNLRKNKTLSEWFMAASRTADIEYVR